MLVHTPLKTNFSLRRSERRRVAYGLLGGHVGAGIRCAALSVERSREIQSSPPDADHPGPCTPRRPSAHRYSYAAVVAASSSSPQPWRVTARPIALRRNTIFAIFFTENITARLRSGGLAGEAGKARTSLSQSLSQ